jgi:hypothetical protein
MACKFYRTRNSPSENIRNFYFRNFQPKKSLPQIFRQKTQKTHPGRNFVVYVKIIELDDSVLVQLMPRFRKELTKKREQRNYDADCVD